MKLIMTRPQHDLTTRYLSGWAVEIKKLAEEKGVEVIDLLKEKANAMEFTGRMEKLRPELVFLNGHGSEECVTGHDDEILIDKKKNSHLLDKKITYALSCHSAKELGSVVASRDKTTYIGYSDKFIFVSDRNFLSRPADDPKARPFKDASNQIMISLLRGRTTSDASSRSKERFKNLCLFFSSSAADPDSLQIAQCLWWNMRNQVCLGDQYAVL